MINNGTVVVVSAKKSDAARISNLVDGAGYDNFYTVVDNTSQIETTNVNALVVVHRIEEQQESAAIVTSLLNRSDKLRVVVLTDCYDEDSIVQFLRRGARNCFNLHESDRILQVRLEAALRVHPGTAQQSFTVGDIHFDIQKRRALRAGRVVDLSPKEFEFARYLFSNPNKIVGNAELMISVWSLPSSMDSRRIDTAACRVRKKLGLDGNSCWKLRRIRRVGYHLQRVQVRDTDLVA